MEKILSDWQSPSLLHENLLVAILAGYLAAKLSGWIPAFFRATPRRLDAWGKNHHQIFVTQTAILAANPEAKALFALREVQYQLRAHVIFSFCILAFYLVGDIPKDAGNPTYWFFFALAFMLFMFASHCWSQAQNARRLIRNSTPAMAQLGP